MLKAVHCICGDVECSSFRLWSWAGRVGVCVCWRRRVRACERCMHGGFAAYAHTLDVFGCAARGRGSRVGCVVSDEIGQRRTWVPRTPWPSDPAQNVWVRALHATQTSRMRLFRFVLVCALQVDACGGNGDGDGSRRASGSEKKGRERGNNRLRRTMGRAHSIKVSGAHDTSRPTLNSLLVAQVVFPPRSILSLFALRHFVFILYLRLCCLSYCPTLAA